MSDIKTLVKQSSHYFVGQIAVLAAGFLSFPILTRIFSVSDYGLMSLVTTTLFIAVAIVKFGMPNSIVRFYAEYSAKNKDISFFVTIFSGIASFAIISGFVFLSAISYLDKYFNNKDLVYILHIVSLLIITGSLNDTLMSFLRAHQRTKLYNILAILRRYLALSLGISLSVYFIIGIKGYFIGQLISGAIILVCLLIIFRKSLILKGENFDFGILKNSFKFGFPLVWAEFGHLVLNYVDRYLIQFYLGSAALGLYTAGYNLATHITEALIYPINYAITPIYMSIIVKKGEKEAKEFFTKIFSYFTLVLLPVTCGSLAVGKDLISVLASEKYIESYTVLSYVILGQAVYACTIILNNGLFIRNKTHIYNNIMIVTCIINIVLNLFMIPIFGIVGAAQATLFSYIAFAIIITYYSFKEFSFKIEYRSILIYALSSLMMVILVKLVSMTNIFIKVITQIFVGSAVYMTVVILLDTNIRKNLFTTIASMSNRHAKHP